MHFKVLKKLENPAVEATWKHIKLSNQYLLHTLLLTRSSVSLCTSELFGLLLGDRLEYSLSPREIYFYNNSVNLLGKAQVAVGFEA